MPEQPSLVSTGSGEVQQSSQISSILQGFDATVSEIIARSMINSSFNGEDRFEWCPESGLRVLIPDIHQWVRFTREPAAELRNRLFEFPNVRGYRHKKAPQPAPIPERSLAWWFAQCIHYGLPVTVDRDEAKNSLRAAIKDDRLVVPQRLLDIEDKLKRSYVVIPQTRPAINAPSLGLSQPAASASAQIVPPPSRTNIQVNIPPVRSRPSGNVTGADRGSSAKDVFDFEESSDDSSSSSDSDEEPFRIPEGQGHLFTPYGVPITRPAEYPGLREKEERLRRQREEVQKREQELFRRVAEKSSRANQASTSGEAGSKTRDTHNSVANSAAKTVVDHDLEDGELYHGDELNGSIGPVQGPSSSKRRSGALKCTTTKLKKAKTKEHTESSRASHDCADDETESLVFYTPMEFMKKRSEHLSDKDSASITTSKTGHKSSSQEKKNEEKRTGCGPAEVVKDKLKHGVGTTREANTTDVKGKSALRVTQPAAINDEGSSSRRLQSEIVSEVATAGRAHADKNEAHKRGRNGKKHVIEISSGSEAERPVMGSSTRSRSTLALRARSASQPQLSDRKGTQALISPSQPVAHRSDPSSSVSQVAKSTKEKAQDLRDTDRGFKVPAKTIATNDGGIGPVSSHEKNEPDQDLDKKKKRKRKKKEKCKRRREKSDLALHLQQQSQIPEQLDGQPLVRDLTGCGITEMCGGLHPDDVNVVQGEGSFGDRLRSASPFIKHPQWIPRSAPKSPSLPPQPSHDENESDWEPPSLTGLFSSQDTPENWKSKERKALEAKERKKEIEKSYDPDSVPALREALTALPAYLKTYMRHDSPELSQNWPGEPQSSAPVFTSTSNIVHTPSRSKSLAPNSRKRTRKSMTEIEADSETISEPKRAHFTSAEPRLMPTSISSPLMATSSRQKSKYKSKSGGQESSKKSRKRTSFVAMTGNIDDDFDEPYDQRTARRKAKSLGPVAKSIER